MATKKELEEAAERGEETAETVQPGPETIAGDGPALGSAEKVDASEIVGEDEDAPKADNKMVGMNSPAEPAPSTEAPNVNPPASNAGKRRGRPKMTDEEKARAKEIRDAVKAGRAPDFSKLPTNKVGGGSIDGVKPARDYYLEACNTFFPASFLLEKWLGPHWGVPIVEKEVNGIKQKVLEPTDEQKQYLANMARWLEYEQFPELNARWGFIVASIAYSVPKLKTDPTPERLMGAREWVRVKIFRKEPRYKKPSEEKKV